LSVLKKIPAVVLEDDDHVLAVAKTKADKRRAQIEAVGHDEVEGPRIILENAAEKTKTAADFVLAFALRLDVQEKRHLAAHQDSQDQAVIILDAAVGHLALGAVGAAAKIGRGRLVSVKDQEGPLQGFVALETIIEGMETDSERIVVQKGEDPAGGVGAGQPRVEAAPPERVFFVLLQGVEAAQTSHGHQKHGREDDMGGNHRPPASIGQGGKKAWDLVSTFRIRQETAKNRLPLLFLLF